MKNITCQTYYGTMHNLRELRDEDIFLEEIAHSLSLQCRYNGHVRKFYSVAEHCVHLVRYARAAGYGIDVLRYLMMHDAAEAYIGDVIRGLKEELPQFIELEKDIDKRIFNLFGISLDGSVIGKYLDTRICADEMAQLMSATSDEYFSNWVDNNQLGIKIKGWSPAKAKRKFLKEAKRLGIED